MQTKHVRPIHFSTFHDEKSSAVLFCPKEPLSLKNLSSNFAGKSFPTDVTFECLPGFDGKRNSRDLTRYIPFSEWTIFQLEKVSLSIAVCGKPDAGKSTLVHALNQDMNRRLWSLSSRHAFRELALRICAIDLDFTSPTLKDLESGIAFCRDTRQVVKRQWTMAAATEMRLALVNALKNNNIVICDMPGHGGPDKISNTLVDSIDFAILMEGEDDNDSSEIWSDYLTRKGVRLLARIVSNPGPKQPCSFVSTYVQSHFMAGTLAGVLRTNRASDPLIKFLGACLLFDLLPSNLFRLHHDASESGSC